MILGTVYNISKSFYILLPKRLQITSLTTLASINIRIKMLCTGSYNFYYLTIPFIILIVTYYFLFTNLIQKRTNAFFHVIHQLFQFNVKINKLAILLASRLNSLSQTLIPNKNLSALTQSNVNNTQDLIVSNVSP